MSVHIKSVATYIPKGRLTAKEIANRSGIPLSVLRDKIGFDEVPVADESDSTTHMAQLAGESAIKKADINPKEIGIVICARGTPQDHFWYIAPTMQGLLNTFQGQVFDVTCGCASMTIALNLAKSLLKKSSLPYALVLASESFARHVNHADSTLVSFFHASDGAGAILLGRDSIGPKLRGFHQVTDGTVAGTISYPALQNPETGRFLQVAQPEKLEAILKLTYLDSYKEAIRGSLRHSDLDGSQLDYLVTNQVKKSTSDALEVELGLDPGRYIRTMRRFGHMGSVDTVLGLERVMERACAGEIAALAASAAGFTWTSQVVEF